MAMNGCKTKVSASFWGDENEGVMRVSGGDLIMGILDKAAFGKFGLVHSVYELYGAQVW